MAVRVIRFTLTLMFKELHDMRSLAEFRYSLPHPRKHRLIAAVIVNEDLETRVRLRAHGGEIRPQVLGAIPDRRKD